MQSMMHLTSAHLACMRMTLSPFITKLTALTCAQHDVYVPGYTRATVQGEHSSTPTQPRKLVCACPLSQYIKPKQRVYPPPDYLQPSEALFDARS